MSDSSNPFASPQTDAVARPEVVWAAEQPEALRKVKLGLTLVYIGICGMLLCVAVLAPLLMFSLGASRIELVALLGLAVLVFSVVMLVGQIFCIAVPAESGARPFAISAVVLEVVCLLAMVLGTIATVVGMLATVGAIGQALANVGSVTCFLLFLRKVAQYIERPDIAARAMRALIVGVLSTIAIAVGAMGPFAPPTQGEFLGWLAILGMLGALVAFVMYANTVTYLRKAITV
ncbi:hypothetical protein NG895_08655 [Aeoliella sp. ICT_H6.2]|uniref:Uncharacterized protein n=1 Tax=Aeoliella straminimaris TaxID=2954799 RepID=A0A9X2JFR1_9BACT|nr:hypothetical protein [Aeoliella straminimaris]MCO6043976.1 hypothetical protein [Aeoliella straminimaris]